MGGNVSKNLAMPSEAALMSLCKNSRDTMHETRGRNIARYQRLHNCILASLPIERQSETDFIRNGDEDIAQIETCSSAELNVVVGATYHFGASQVGRVSGEDIW